MKPLLFILCMGIAINGLAQQNVLKQKVSLEAKSWTVAKIIEEIAKQADIDFSFNPNEKSLQQRKSVSWKRVPLKTALDELLQGSDMQYKWMAGQIVLFRMKKGQGNRSNAGKMRYTISGYLKDLNTGEPLITAMIMHTQNQQAVLTNEYGFFGMKLEAGNHTIMAKMAGYCPQEINLSLQKDTTIHFELDYMQLQTVEIRADLQENNLRQHGVLEINANEIESLPSMFGENDVVRALQLMPGVQGGAEGNTGLYVRGGGPDQNLILLDGVPMYYVSHLGGFFSIFNSDALSQIRLIKGGFPARYGGRLSSVLDIRMKEGNMEEFGGEGSLGLIAGRLALQGPIKKGKSSFMISGRRTWMDLLLRPITRSSSGGTTWGGYRFYDLNVKLNYHISDKDKLYLSGYFGDDRVTVKGRQNSERYQAKSGWGNQLGVLRWNHVWSNQLFSNFTFFVSNYQFYTTGEAKSSAESDFPDAFSTFRFRSGVRDWGFKTDFDFFPHPKHRIRFGTRAIYHTYIPGKTQYESQLSDSSYTKETQELPTHRPFEVALYAEDEWKIGERFLLNAGLHGMLYHIDRRNFLSLQPRISGSYQFHENMSVSAAYASMMQALHLLSNTSVGLPIDLWVPATAYAEPKRSWQTSVGFHSQFAKQMFSFDVEAYYKRMNNLIAYSPGNDFYFGNESVESWGQIIESGGKGETYGAELLLRKRKGKTQGWIGYTLSWNWREFAGINDGERYPYRYDRRHDIGAAITHDFNDKVKLSATWVYRTGAAITLPTATYAGIEPQDQTGSYQGIALDAFGPYRGVQLYEHGRNNFRMEAQHRLDLSLQFQRPTKWGKQTWSISLYNAYNRKNPYTYFLESQNYADGSFETRLKRFALFPVFPTVSYGFKF